MNEDKKNTSNNYISNLLMNIGLGVMLGITLQGIIKPTIILIMGFLLFSVSILIKMDANKTEKET